MRHLSYADFLQDAPLFDRIALDAPGIDGYCSSTRWCIPALESFTPEHAPQILALENGYAAFARVNHPEIGRVDMPFDATWGLGCPLVLSDPRLGLLEFRASLQADPQWEAVVIAGVDPDSELFVQLRWLLGRQFVLRRASETRRSSASLVGGVDGFLARRSRKLRANLRRSEQRAGGAGVRFVRHRLRCAEDIEAAYPLILAIEATSWKSRNGEGVDREPMRGFIRRVLLRAASAGDDVRLLIAERDGVPIGYLHGALCERAFRGLQMSYHDDHAELSLGNLMQLEMVRWLTQDSEAHTYDLGAELEYKRAWGERSFATWTVLVFRG